jgi:putative ABC transport system permease protein
VKIISGRDFGISSQADARESVIVNEEFLKAFSIKGDPIGQRVLINDSIPLYIVGVTEEIYINALFTPLQPVAFRNCEQKDYQWLTAKVDKSNILEVNESIEKTWAGLFPTKLYPGTLMDEQLETTMNHFKNVSKLYAFLGLVTVVLAMTGLFAMISLHIRKKLKEIGLRKMLGGHAAHLSIVASRPFIIVVGVSLIIGTTAGVFVANLFLDYVWEYYQQTEWLIVTGAIVGTIGLAVITVLSQVLSAVRINPIDIIKEE